MSVCVPSCTQEFLDSEQRSNGETCRSVSDGCSVIGSPCPARMPSDRSPGNCKGIVIQCSHRSTARQQCINLLSLCRFSESCELESFLSFHAACSLPVGASEGGKQTSSEVKSGLCTCLSKFSTKTCEEIFFFCLIFHSHFRAFHIAPRRF